jgi:hypothetical protein
VSVGPLLVLYVPSRLAAAGSAENNPALRTDREGAVTLSVSWATWSGNWEMGVWARRLKVRGA